MNVVEANKTGVIMSEKSIWEIDRFSLVRTFRIDIVNAQKSTKSALE